MKKAKVTILLEGYVSAESDGHSCSTVTLVQDDGLNIVVDPGTLRNQKILVDALKKEGLEIDDINVVYITHSHMDHYRNIGMFSHAKALDYFGWWIEDEYRDYTDPSRNIKMINTPGHSKDGTTLLVETEEGTVAICGDVFWKENYPNKDPYAVDAGKLEDSRKKVLSLADYIIPGHGGVFGGKKK